MGDIAARICRILRYNSVMALPILKEPPITSREALIPYAMSALNMLAPTIAARAILLPQIFLVSIFLILMGIPCSVYFRQRQYHRIILNLIITIPLLIMTWAMVNKLPGLQFNWSDPVSSMLAHDSSEQLDGVLHVFTLLAAGRAFLIVTSADLLQTPLPGISIFLLAVITNNNMERDAVSYICLMVLFISSIYLFSQEQSQHWFSIHTPQRIQLRLIDWTILFCLALFPLVFWAGRSLNGFNMSTMAARGNRGQYLHLRLLNLSRSVAISSSPTIEMGGANWPTGKIPVMDVTVDKNSSQSLLWRANSYSTYDNSVWSNITAPPTLEENDGWHTEPAGPLNQITLESYGEGKACDPGVVEMRKEMPEADWVAKHVTQTFDMKAPFAGERAPVYGAFQIERIKSNDTLFAHPFVETDGGVALALNKTEIGSTLESSYEVTSFVKPLPTANLPLKKVKTPQPSAYYLLEKDPPLPAMERARYLQMPGNTDGTFQSQIRQLALKILTERGLTPSSSPFNQVNQIELYLGEHYRYTLTPKAPKDHADPIVDFLYTHKEGYCNYFSGSMVMLCRSIGLPARFVVGYATGDLDEKQSNDQKAKYHVNSEQAHSWVEVYLPHYGWYTVDPTSGSRVATTSLAQAWDNVLGVITSVKTAVTTWWTDVQKNVTAKWYTLFVGIYLLFVVLLVLYFRRERPPDFPRTPLSPAAARETVLQAYRRMHRWLDIWGVLKPEGLTAKEFEQLFCALNAVLGESVSELTDLYIRAQYTDDPIDDADARRAITLLHQLWEHSRTERKRLFVSEA